MAISAGDSMPEGTFGIMTDAGPGAVSADDLFAGKKVVLFSVPGAFTPTCSTYQLPDFERLAGDFEAKGIDEIYCLSVSDAFVMNALASSRVWTR